MTIKIVEVKLPKPGLLGSLQLPGGWQCSLDEPQAPRLKPYKGREVEIGEILRLTGSH